jgi:hypothetical protein
MCLWHVTNECKPFPGETFEQFKAGPVFRAVAKLFQNDSYETLWQMFGYKGESNKAFGIRISKMKAAGLVPGVYDLHFFWMRRLYLFELKVGSNKQSAEQEAYGRVMHGQGAITYEIRTLEQFQSSFQSIICQ